MTDQANPQYVPAPVLPPAGAMDAFPLTGLSALAAAALSPPAPTGPVVLPPPAPTGSLQRDVAAAAPPPPPPRSMPKPPSFPKTGGQLNALDPAMSSLVSMAVNNVATPQKFFLVILPDESWPRCEVFATVDELIVEIKKHLDTACCLYAFMGHRLGISDGPLRYLSTPIGALPLFKVPEPSPSVVSGWVGPPIATPAPVPAMLPPAVFNMPAPLSVPATFPPIMNSEPQAAVAMPAPQTDSPIFPT